MPENPGRENLRKPSSEILRILAENMIAFRAVRGISQETMAEMCNLHRTYIGSVERGERNITLSTLEVIAGAMGVATPQLLIEGSIKRVAAK